MKDKVSLAHYRIVVVFALCTVVACTGCSTASTVSSTYSPETPEDSSSSPESAPVYPSIDVGDASDRAFVNSFLDVYTEALSSHGDYVVDEIDLQTKAMVAVNFVGLRERGEVEDGEYTDIAGVGGGARNTSNARIRIEVIQDVARRYLGGELDLQSLSDRDNPYTYDDGYLYFGRTAPFGQTAYYPAVTTAEPLGEGRYRVEFDIVTGRNPYGSLNDGESIDLAESVFPLTSDEMRDFFDGDSSCSGEAVLSIVFNGQDKELALESIRFKDGEEAEAPSSNADSAISLEGVALDVNPEDDLYTINFMKHPDMTVYAIDDRLVVVGPVRIWDMMSEIDYGDYEETEVAIAFKLDGGTYYCDERMVETDIEDAEITREEFEEKLANGEFEWLDVYSKGGTAVTVGQTYY